jgi:hypothetical protein
MSYVRRRYRVVDGKLKKVWNGTNEPGWFKVKADAWAAAAVPQEPHPTAPTEKVAEGTPAADYETWKAPQLRAEIKVRTGKGPKVGTESSKVAMIEKLRGLDAAA